MFGRIRVRIHVHCRRKGEGGGAATEFYVLGVGREGHAPAKPSSFIDPGERGRRFVKEDEDSKSLRRRWKHTFVEEDEDAAAAAEEDVHFISA